MGALYVLQGITAAALLLASVLLTQFTLAYDGLSRRLTVPLASWCVHGTLFFTVLFVVRLDAGGVLGVDQSVVFNWWSSAVRLHGALSCLLVWWVLRDSWANGHG